MKLPLESEFRDQAPRMLRKDKFLAWHEKLVAWEQNRHEFSTEEKTECSWGERGIKVGDGEVWLGKEGRKGKDGLGAISGSSTVTLSNVRIA
ncbi:hypothetical protein Pyn_23857 [Prunus yedoensis var. nudiflora]|uniref:Uncharacterized protein n=1 Tax=Prunus yedoensis var. nudiflora TaxID=2094558 RepID=A0A314ZHL9_PRUYE|nr:hypothetical protein Pyn_23857 [Prunus yedoensis var. nudiflora]